MNIELEEVSCDQSIQKSESEVGFQIPSSNYLKTE